MAHSASLPIFLNTARELAAKLEGDPHPEAIHMLREAEDLARVFLAWENEVPEAHQRSTSVSAVLDLQRRVMDYLAAHQHHAAHTGHHG